jgi:hypothetical protein
MTAVQFKFLSAFTCFATIIAAPLCAYAQDPEPLPRPAATSNSADGSGATGTAVRPQQSIPITQNCALGMHAGLDEADAITAADIVCHEIVRQGGGGNFEVRLGKLGAQVQLTVATAASPQGTVAYDERRILMTGLPEISIAAPRVVSALLEKRAVAATETSDNLLQSETRRPLVKNGHLGLDAGLLIASSVGATSGLAPGFNLGIRYRTERYGIGGELRHAGGGETSSTLRTTAIGLGARYFLSAADTAPFAGGGVGMSHIGVERSGGTSVSGTGASVYLEAGAEFFRTHRVGMSASLRADAPLFVAKASGSAAEGDAYVIPVSLQVGMQFW